MQYSNYKPKEQREGTWNVKEKTGMETKGKEFFVLEERRSQQEGKTSKPWGSSWGNWYPIPEFNGQVSPAFWSCPALEEAA